MHFLLIGVLSFLPFLNVLILLFRISFKIAFAFWSGIPNLCVKYLNEAASSPSGPPYWLIITFARNATLNDGDNKDRQTLYNVGTLDGYYITNGKAIKITCEKSSRSAQTVYKDLDGNEIKVNDGNTYIQICPIDAKVVIEGEEEPEAETNTEVNIIE